MKIAVVGATGNVGSEILKVLEVRKFSPSEISFLASNESIGKNVVFKGKNYSVLNIESFDFTKVNVVIFAVESAISRKYRERVLNAGAILIDNSAAFRMEEGVPLVVPDVNTEALKNFKQKNLISSPNCTTSQMVMALKPLHDVYKIERIVASTYQSTSGAGRDAMNELYNRTKAFFEIQVSGRNAAEFDSKTSSFTKDIAFNCIPHIDKFMEDGKTQEEWKMEVETKKIFNDESIKVCATCVRVPVFIGHAISLNIEFKENVNFEEALHLISEFEPVVMLDKREDGGYATHREVARTFGVFVSRFRLDTTKPNTLNMWVVADNVYGIGAAYNVVRILEELVKIM